MPTIRLDLTKLPPASRRQAIRVVGRPEAIAQFIRSNHWTETRIAGAPPPNALVRVYQRSYTGGKALAAGYGVVLRPDGKTSHRLLVVHCWNSELPQLCIDLEKIIISYLSQLAGNEVTPFFHLTEISDVTEREVRSRIGSPQTTEIEDQVAN